MAGRPAAPQFIVPEGDILHDNAIFNKNYNITLLARKLVDTLTQSGGVCVTDFWQIHICVHNVLFLVD